VLTLAKKILKELYEAEIRYKGGTSASLSDISKLFGANKNSYKSSVTRLHKNGFIKKEGGGWLVTNEGKQFLSQSSLKSFESPFTKSAKKDLLLMFDIPEEYRQYRNWLREQLKEFGYVMVQRSVWAGPSPLPLEFKAYIKKLKLQKTIRTFKLAKAINIK
jgi:CRISPR-associated endonuclease Cas2